VDDRGRKEMGDKLVMHCRGPKETAIRYNRYVVNGKLFRTQTHDEYYDMTKYVLFKCDWADTTRDIRYKVNEYGLVFVNFKKLFHTGKLIIDEPYVLTTQVNQVFYVEDERDPSWA
jgi:hypothetical protein